MGECGVRSAIERRGEPRSRGTPRRPKGWAAVYATGDDPLQSEHLFFDRFDERIAESPPPPATKEDQPAIEEIVAVMPAAGDGPEAHAGQGEQVFPVRRCQRGR